MKRSKSFLSPDAVVPPPLRGRGEETGRAAGASVPRLRRSHWRRCGSARDDRGRGRLQGRCSRGAAALEFALVLPLLMLLVMGMLDWGYYFFTEQIVVNAAREGARSGSLESTDDAISRADAETTARGFLSRGGLDPARATVSVTLTADSVLVGITYPAGSLTGLSDLVVPANARAAAEMRR